MGVKKEDTIPDTVLVQLLAEDDEKAFEIVFKRYYSALCTYAFDLLKNDGISEEIVQEAFMRLWENRSRLEVKVSLKSYLYRIIHNQCVNFFKHEQVNKKQAGKYSEEARLSAELTVMADQDFSLDSYFYEGLEHDIESAIDSLPEQCRVIFRLSRYEMMGHEQIAKQLNISVNTVKTQIARALEKLRVCLKPRIMAQKDLSNGPY